MTSKQLFDKVSIRTSRMTTRAYSTSFSLGIFCLKPEYRDPIYALYGWVRFADEIVDTFHDFDKKTLLERFRKDTYQAIEEGISLNPILNSFQHTVNTYKIEKELTDTFLRSMEWDLSKTIYDEQSMKEYILGSAEVVGLMSLRVFCKGDNALYEQLKPAAMSLGSAFQKVNFLRDLKADFSMGRVYFPELELDNLNEENKQQIEDSIQQDFDNALIGIKNLPKGARFGVYVAYVYYLSLFKKIQNAPSEIVLNNRIRVKNRHKIRLLAYSYVKHQLNLI
ncbi:phytoene/squalene synthase family protein [Chryseotalea sanaruensis]|uniref:Phytoene/squalene synthase family protein n=1 Tax=Chryseotalea sanaruensis TaxID=2482724 RepID=A0A401U5X9_9BACT|nr:phytoene/squalene synthase family protein [Chryseotalea sanaruensis]GCC50196.1 phytoene/squalene synthase family protein [Chryseotalea sanaruensis]